MEAGGKREMGAVTIFSRDQRDFGAELVGRGHHVVYRCLLYTSPSPRD